MSSPLVRILAIICAALVLASVAIGGVVAVGLGVRGAVLVVTSYDDAANVFGVMGGMAAALMLVVAIAALPEAK